ncbi:hypothetical protein SBRY_50539 [Actinacidiphila bryophytorum]|uniref:Uncharacterized protein n=1 Tax=Actinacidiphila bryophytorum TaxID=1436133 RepID=A0A9W4H548_9ACTN|nr:hypothetical protein SBRY_50539 [Actinacidiphila bryophytorum]
MGRVVRPDSLGACRHFGLVKGTVFGLVLRDVVVNGLTLELTLHGFLDI